MVTSACNKFSSLINHLPTIHSLFLLLFSGSLIISGTNNCVGAKFCAAVDDTTGSKDNVSSTSKLGEESQNSTTTTLIDLYIPPTLNKYKSKTNDSSVYEFIIPKSTQGFEFTCISSQPVSWKYDGIAVSSPDIKFSRGRNLNSTCFFITMTFPVSAQEMTGVYTCYQLNSPSIVSKSIILYAGHSKDGFLVLGKQGFTYRDTKAAHLNLPCATNSPDTNVSLWTKMGEQWKLAPKEAYSFDPLLGLNEINGSLAEAKIVSIAVGTARFKCDTELSRQDAVYFPYEGPPDVLIKPNTQQLFLSRNLSSLILECYADVPLEFSENSTSSYKIEALNTTSTNGYSYGLRVNLRFTNLLDRISFANEEQQVFVDEDENGSSRWNVSCAEKGDESSILHTWTLGFSEDVFTPSLVFDQSTSSATCFSSSPSEIKFYYIFCNLLVECEFLKPCLHESPEWACKEPLQQTTKIIAKNETSVTVQLHDLSGAFACIGVDVNETIYFYRGASTGKIHLDEDQTDLIEINIPGSHEITFDNLVQVECLASSRFCLDEANVELWYGGEYFKTVPKDLLLIHENSTVNGIITNRVQFKLQETNVDEIVCVVERADGNQTLRKGVGCSVRRVVSSANWIAIALGVIGVIIFISGLVLAYYWRAISRRKNSEDTKISLTDLEREIILRFRQGSPHELLNLKPPKKKNDNGSEPPAPESDADRLSIQDGHSYAQLLPYNNEFEIDTGKLEIDTDKVLGFGEFSMVYRATYDNGLFGVPVAAKKIRPNARNIYLQALLAEIKIMIYVGKHEHIVEFLGACTQNKLDACIVLRLYPYGTMEKFLQSHRQSFAYQNLAILTNTTSSNASSGYVNPTELSLPNLMKWSIEIANALEYLFYKKVIHGDLATRNILLDETMTVKVSDFGLARQRYVDFDFPKLCDMPLPWQWMSLESLKYLDFTQQSDLWSYGITLWEMFSLAEVPYVGQCLNSKFVTELENGKRLEKPANASEELYKIMKTCWKENPSERMNISEIKSNLINIAATPAPPITPTTSAKIVNYKQIDFQEDCSSSSTSTSSKEDAEGT